MKVAYLIEQELGTKSNIGVLNKLAYQADIWFSSGVLIKFFFISSTLPNVNHSVFEKYEFEIINPLKFKYAVLDLNWIFGPIDKFRPDIVQVNIGSIFYPSIIRLIRKYPNVFEINTDDLLEFKSREKYLKYIVYLLSRYIGIRYINGFVAVSYELAEKFRLKGKDTIVIPNLIDFRKINPLPPTNNKNPRLVFIASADREWYGIDKIVYLAKKRRNWNFTIAGNLDSYANVLNELENIEYVGYVPPEKIPEMLINCDIGIGTLAFHRSLHLNEASPLKMLDYLACGLPVIAGHKVTNYYQGADFILELPNTENNIKENLDRIDDFVKKWTGKRISTNELYPISSKKEEERVEFFNRIIKKAH